MKYLNEKLKIIYVPSLLMTVSFIIAYTFLHWLLFIQLHLFPVKDEILDIMLPLALPWLPILLWFRKRTKIIKEKGSNGKGDPRTGFLLVIWLAMAAPLTIAQSYLETACGKLTPLENINQVNEHPITKYYTLQHYYFDKRKLLVHPSLSISGKQNENLNFNMHILVPIYTDSNNVDSGKKVLAWYGIKYYKQISNDKNEDAKEKKWDEFVQKCQGDFDSANLQKFVYLENEGLSDDRDRYIKALEKKGIGDAKNAIILIPKDEPFEARNGNKLPWILGSFSIGALVVFLVLLLVKIDDNELSKYNSGEHNADNDIKEFFSYFIPNKAQFITPIIIDLNILVFLFMVFSGLGLVNFSSADLIKLGADYGPLTKNGQWWRLFTSTFLHGGIMHLLANMYGLMFVGIFLEPVIGRGRYLAAYIITGILASATSLWWHDTTVSVGASGAIFGMYGVFLALLLMKIFPKEVSKPFLISTSIFVGYNLLMGMAGGIDNAAHIGGLVSGFVIGLIFYPGLKKNSPGEWQQEAAEQNDSEHS